MKPEPIVTNSTAAFDSTTPLEAIRKAMALINSLQKVPNTYVMTRQTWQAIRQHFKTSEPRIALPHEIAIYGVPFELYDTLKQCFDRMIEPQAKGFQLVLGEDVPDELQQHPFYLKACLDVESKLHVQ